MSLSTLRDSRVWKWLGDISLVHWIICGIGTVLTGVAAIMHGKPLELILVYALGVGFLASGTSYLISKHWRRETTGTKGKRPKCVGVGRPEEGKRKDKILAWILVITASALGLIHYLDRPQLFIEAFHVLPFYQGARPALNVFYRNEGNAVKVRTFYIFGNLHLTQSEPKEQFRSEDDMWAMLRHRVDDPLSLPEEATVPPKSSQFLTLLGREMSTEEIQKLNNKNELLYFMGIFTYPTGLGNHEMHFCVYWQQSDPRVIHQCLKHND